MSSDRNTIDPGWPWLKNFNITAGERVGEAAGVDQKLRPRWNFNCIVTIVVRVRYLGNGLRQRLRRIRASTAQITLLQPLHARTASMCTRISAHEGFFVTQWMAS